METRALRGELHEHGHGAVRLRAGNREEAVGDLALHHHAPALQSREAVQRLDDERRRDVVRKVRDELARRGIQRSEIEAERVAEVDADVVRDVAQMGRQRFVQLDRMDERHASSEVASQDAEPGTDLEHDVVLLQLREPADDAEQVLVDEEMLAEVLLRADAHGNEKQALAFASMRAARSTTSSSRASASAATVWTTFAGSFGRPRRGCGARYGESVSTSSRSPGTARAAARRSYAFLNVTLPANETYQPCSSAGSSSPGDEKQCITIVPSKLLSAARVSSSAARVWTTTGMRSSRASSSCASNTRRCASRGAWSR